jgi:hypothetical protein
MACNHGKHVLLVMPDLMRTRVNQQFLSEAFFLWPFLGQEMLNLDLVTLN